MAILYDLLGLYMFVAILHTIFFLCVMAVMQTTYPGRFESSDIFVKWVFLPMEDFQRYSSNL